MTFLLDRPVPPEIGFSMPAKTGSKTVDNLRRFIGGSSGFWSGRLDLLLDSSLEDLRFKRNCLSIDQIGPRCTMIRAVFAKIALFQALWYIQLGVVAL